MFFGSSIQRGQVLIIAVLSFFVIELPHLDAQDYEKIAPKTPPKKETPAELPQTNLTPEEGNENVLVDKLEGIVFIKDINELKPAGFTGVRRIQIDDDLKLLKTPEFEGLVSPYLGQPVSMKLLNRLTNDVITYYRDHNMPVVHITVPEGQDITSGVVQVLVIEGRLGQVRIEGNHWVDSDMITEQIRLQRGDLLMQNQLLADLNWINNNPFRQVTPMLTMGENPGESDLLLKTTDRFPVRFYTGYEDSGNDLTGDERIRMGFNWGNAFNLDHQMSYQFMTDLNFNKLQAHSGSYMIPLPWRHTLNFFGSYAETKADFASPLFNLNGLSWQVSARYNLPLPTIGKYLHEVAGGYDYKQSNNNLEFGGARVFATTTEISQFVLTYSGVLNDEWGRTTFSPSVFLSPGRMMPKNSDQNFLVSRAFSSAEYTYGRLSVERLAKLPSDFSWIVKGLYQWSDSNLLGSEQLGLGGYTTVRGYEEREANGDEGFLVTTEIRTPPISFAKLTGFTKVSDEFQVLAFYDFGQIENRHLLVGEDPHVQLASAGPGVRWTINPYLSLRFDYGFQLYDTGLSSRYNSRGHVGIMISY